MGSVVGSMVDSRLWNIAFRTAHIVAAAGLFGGHVFGVHAEQLLWWLYATIFSGAVLMLLEAYPNLSWCYQPRGACVVVKLVLLMTIPWFWDYRVPILVAVLIIASVGSHMPRRFRHYSLMHRRELLPERNLNGR